MIFLSITKGLEIRHRQFQALREIDEYLYRYISTFSLGEWQDQQVDNENLRGNNNNINCHIYLGRVIREHINPDVTTKNNVKSFMFVVIKGTMYRDVTTNKFH